MTGDAWYPIDEGQSIGLQGTEEGTIIRDEEHPDGARITLERSGRTPWAITCGIYGWTFLTCFFSDEAAAQQTYDEMKSTIEVVLEIIPDIDDPELEKKKLAAGEAVAAFVERFW